MASEVQICNMALSHLGDSATVSSIEPPEGSAQAEHCAIWYPVARNSLLELHDWSFATVRQPLAELAMTVPGWLHAYAHPSNVVRLLSVQAPGFYVNQPYLSESDAEGNAIILTNAAGAVVRYTREVSDASKFPPLFVDVLGWYLSTYLAGPLLKGESGIQVANANMKVAMGMLAQAKLSDANQQRQAVQEHVVPWLGVR